MSSQAQPIRGRRFAAYLLAFLLPIATSLAHSSEELDQVPDFWEKYADIADWLTLRLQLTPEQEDKVLPIMEQNFQAKKALAQEYGVFVNDPPPLTIQQKEEIDAKVIAIRMETRAKLVNILNADQLQELKKIQEEFHEEFAKELMEE